MCDNIDYKIGVMQAFKEGKVIEYRNMLGSWYSSTDPMWNWDKYDYRVKPEPKEDWLVEYHQYGEAMWKCYNLLYSQTEAHINEYITKTKLSYGPSCGFRYRRIEPAKE